MSRSISPFVFAFVAAATLLAGAATAQDAQRPSVAVVGRGEVAAPPDMARLGFGVMVRAASASEAWTEAGRRMAAILEAAREAGVADQDLRTTELAMSPVHDHSGDGLPEVTGYEARRRAEATVRDLAALGPLLDAAAEAGANLFDGVSFDLSDPAAALATARRAAVEDAREAAETLAGAAGATLGAPISLSLDGGGGPEPMMMRAASMEDAGVAPGVVTVRASVSAVYSLE